MVDILSALDLRGPRHVPPSPAWLPAQSVSPSHSESAFQWGRAVGGSLGLCLEDSQSSATDTDVETEGELSKPNPVEVPTAPEARRRAHG